MGADRVIFGSDWPHIEGMPEPLDYVAELSKFDDHKKKRILRDNVRRAQRAPPRMKKALAGIRVLDLSTPLAEASGRILADLGAEVLKIEPPGGCASRFVPPYVNPINVNPASSAPSGEAEAAGQTNDPEGSLFWRMWGRGKRSVVLDLDGGSHREQFLGLVRGADILIESSTPGEMAARGLGYADLAKINPSLLYLSVTPFGQHGCYATHPATDLTLSAAGGLLNMQGDGSHPPIPVGFPETAHLGASQAAADVILALYARNRTGQGQHLDTSIQAAVLWSLMNVTDYAALGQNPPGFGDDRTGRVATMPIMPGLTLPVCEPCKDGFVVMTLVLGAQGMHGFNEAMKWVGAQGGLDADLLDVDWYNWIALLGEGKLSVEDANRGVDQFLAHLRTMTKAEIQEQAVAQKWLIAPVNLAPDLLNDPQLKARDFWVDVDGDPLPGPFARLSETPIEYDRPAPRLGQDQSLIDTQERQPLAPVVSEGDESASREGGRAGQARTSVFEGLKVADFSWIAAGPLITKDLANLGATVLRVESESRLDTLRFIPPFVGDPGTSTGHMAANMNQSKLGIAINFGTEKGLEIAHKMVEWADVVVENFTPGTAERIGLGYEQLRKINPKIVMLYTCMRGQTGPEAKHTGFGLHGAALGGFVGVTGWPDGKPCAPWGAYTDFISPRFALAALGAALHHRDQTGQRAVHRRFSDRSFDPFPRADDSRLRPQRPRCRSCGTRLRTRLPPRRLRNPRHRALHRHRSPHGRAVARADGARPRPGFARGGENSNGSPTGFPAAKKSPRSCRISARTKRTRNSPIAFVKRASRPTPCCVP